MKMSKKNKQTGFTLIEALIAFVVLTVGILGAILFQAELLGESGQSKAKSEAIRIAEAKVELLRAAATSSAFESIIGAGPQVASVPDGTNTVYTVTYASQAVSSAEFSSNLTKVTVNVGWPDGEGVSLSSIINWLDPARALQLNEAGTTNDDPDSETVVLPNPGGLATALERVSVALGSVSAGDVVTENATIDGKLVSRSSVLVNGSYISLISTPSASDAVMSITGVILDNPNSKSNVAWDYIKPAGGVSDSFLDVQSSTGSNCVIYEIVNKDYSESGPRYAYYKCLFSVGWAGNIGLYQNEVGSVKVLEDGNDVVCYNNPRGYKYLIGAFDLVSTALPSSANPGDITSAGFTSITDGSVVNTNLTFYIGASEANSSIEGQSGLVPFNTGTYDIANYFIVNPNLNTSTGSVSDQNFFISNKSGGNTPCETNMSAYYTAVSSAVASATSIAQSSFPTDGTGDDILFGINSINEDIHDKNGDVILGYILLDDTEAPAFSDQNIVFSQGQSVDAVIGSIVASDNVAIDSFKFVNSGAISDTSSDGSFKVDSSGVVTLAGVEPSSAQTYSMRAKDAAGFYTDAMVTFTPVVASSCSITAFSWDPVTTPPTVTTKLTWTSSNCGAGNLYFCKKNQNFTCTPNKLTDSTATTGTSSNYNVGQTVAAEKNSTYCYKLFADTEESSVKCMRNTNNVLSFP